MYLENGPGGKRLRTLGWGGVEWRRQVSNGPRGGLGWETRSAVAMGCGQNRHHTTWGQGPIASRTRRGGS